MEYWNSGKGIIRLGGLPVVEFITSHPNLSNALYGHCGSGYPKIQFTFPLEQSRRSFILRPEPSPCPESCFASNALCSLCGTCKDKRNFYVTNLTQGSCSIINIRTCSEACGKVWLCQGSACYPHVDYPRFKVNFTNVAEIDKFAILMGLVHYSYFKKWYFIAHICHTAVGLG